MRGATLKVTWNVQNISIGNVLNTSVAKFTKNHQCGEMFKTLVWQNLKKKSSVWRNFQNIRPIKTKWGQHESHLQNGTKLEFSFGKLFKSQSTSYMSKTTFDEISPSFVVKCFWCICQERSPSCCSLHSSHPLGCLASRGLMLRWSNSPETKQG